MLHEQRGSLDGALERGDLLVVILRLGLVGLHLRQGVIHLHAGVEQRLAEGERGRLLFGAGDSQLCAQATVLEEGLRERRDGRPDEITWVGDGRPCAARPAGRSAQRDGGIEGRTGGVSRIESGGQTLLGAHHVRTLRQERGRQPDAERSGHLPGVHLATLHGVNAVAQQDGQPILRLADLLAEGEHRGADAVPVGLGLRHGGVVVSPGRHQRAHGLDVLLPVGGRLFGDLQLLVEHGQRIIIGSDARDDLRLHRLSVGVTGQEQRPGALAGVAEAAEDVELPRGRQREAIRLRGRGAVYAAERGLRRQRKGGQEGQVGRRERRLGLLHLQVCPAEIRVVTQPALDKCLEADVGEDVAPGQAPQVRCVAVGLFGVAIEAVRADTVGALIVRIDAAAVQHGRCDEGEEGPFHYCHVHHSAVLSVCDALRSFRLRSRSNCTCASASLCIAGRTFSCMNSKAM